MALKASPWPTLEALQARLQAAQLELYQESERLLPIGMDVMVTNRAGSPPAFLRVTGRSKDGQEVLVKATHWKDPMAVRFDRVSPIMEVARGARP